MAAARAGQYVIESKLEVVAPNTAVLAAVAIAHQYVRALACRAALTCSDIDILDEPYNRRSRKDEALRAQYAVAIVLDYLSSFLPYETDCARNTHCAEWLV